MAYFLFMHRLTYSTPWEQTGLVYRRRQSLEHSGEGGCCSSSRPHEQKGHLLCKKPAGMLARACVWLVDWKWHWDVHPKLLLQTSAWRESLLCCPSHLRSIFLFSASRLLGGGMRRHRFGGLFSVSLRWVQRG